MSWRAAAVAAKAEAEAIKLLNEAILATYPWYMRLWFRLRRLVMF